MAEADPVKATVTVVVLKGVEQPWESNKLNDIIYFVEGKTVTTCDVCIVLTKFIEVSTDSYKL
jgi:hypothetical protein